MKAFLSHSHVDAELVQAVAQRIGRAFVNIDTVSFKAADDLVSIMESAVRESAVFVFFASRSSFSSAWVNYELQEARYQLAIRRIRKFVVVVLDDRIGYKDFPEWMTHTLFVRSKSAGPIARVVRQAIDDLITDQQNEHFVGRGKEAAALQSAFVPWDGTSHVPIVAVRGLPGIGRRTLLRRIIGSSISLDRLILLRVEPGDSVNSLAIKLADLVEVSNTPDDAIAMAGEIEDLPSGEAVERIVTDLQEALVLRELVVLYDDGGMLNDDGELSNDLRFLLKALGKRNDIIVACVTNRRMSWKDVPELSQTPIVNIGQLSQNEVRQLLALMAKSNGVVIPTSEIGALAEQARGYPPAVRAIIQMIQSHGLQIAANAARRQAEYQPRPLTSYLKKLRLSATQRKILTILARNSPLPTEILESFALGSETAVDALFSLIDMSLVVPQEGTSWYKINDPIIDYVIRELPQCTVEDYRAVADGLSDFLAQDEENGAYLELSRVFYRASVHAGKDRSRRAYALMADILKLAAELYHQRDYGKALEHANMAHEAKSSSDALTWIIKCNVKLGEYSAALEKIAELRRIGLVRDAYFLRGFLERNRADYEEAVKYYELARRAGRGGLALERDLAECYFHTGDMEKAMAHVSEAQQKQTDNRYVVNLRIKIACRQGDEAVARGLLDLVDEVDGYVFAQHRRARVELVFGDAEKAYEHAKNAVDASARPPAETLSTLVQCQIKTGRYDDAAETLNVLESLYPKQRKDVLLRWRARLAIVEQRFEDALGYWAQISKKSDPAHIVIQRDAVQGLLTHTNMPGAERREKEKLISNLNGQLTSKFGSADWEEVDVE